MSDDRGKLTSFDWPEIFPWLNLATALRLAIKPRVLVLAAVALLGTVAGWRICGSVCTHLFIGSDEERSEAVFSNDPIQMAEQARIGHFEATVRKLTAWPWEQPTLPQASARELSQSMGSWWTENPLVQARLQITAPFEGLLDPHASLMEFVFLLLCAVWELVVWAFFGGAITRMAAVALARDEQLSWGQLTAYARSKWSAYFTAPLFPLLGVLLATIPLVVFGLLLRLELGLLIGGILWFVPLLVGLFMAILMVGLYFGWPLMWATISVEGTDSFDALSRSYAYTYQRPLHYFFYSVVAGLLGILGWIAVAIFVSATIALSTWAVSWTSGAGISPDAVADYRWSALLGDGGASSQADSQSLGPLGQTGVKLIGLWVDVAVTLALGFVFSFFWTSTTAIYFLLRRQVDATEMDEVFLPEEQQPYGLPPLEQDAAGVAGVGDAPPAS